MYQGNPPHEAGTVIKNLYEVDKLLSTADSARVYRGHRKADGHPVAIKELSMQDMQPERMEQTFLQFDQEGALLKKLQHKGLVEVLDCFSSAGGRYIIMEFYEGHPLDLGIVEGQPPAAVVTVLEWMDQVCDFLIYLHEHEPSIVLRNLHPGNILLAKDGKTIQVLDLGIAKTMDGKGTLLRDTGAAEYAPVEQFGGTGVDQRVDVYALGATLYALLTNLIPPPSMNRVLDDPLVPPDTLNPKIPKPLNDLILRLMTVGRQSRPDNIRAIRGELKEIYESLNPKPAVPPPKGKTAPAAKAGKAGCMPMLLIGLVALGATLLHGLI